jgi:membrane protein DedA with SNARE-associated domain
VSVWIEIITLALGVIAGVACSYLHIRFGLRKKLETQLRKEIYDSAKLDGAYEFAQQHLFGFRRPKPKDGHRDIGDQGHAGEKVL